MSTFRRGIVTAIGQEHGTIRGLTSWDAQEPIDIRLAFDDACFLNINTADRDLSYGLKILAQSNGVTHLAFRKPRVGDIIRFDCAWSGGALVVTMWTYEVHYQECEDQLPRCTAKDCTNAPRLRMRCCAFHASLEDEDFADEDTVSMGTVLHRAHDAINNPEQARQAARDYPGDFI